MLDNPNKGLYTLVIQLNNGGYMGKMQNIYNAYLQDWHSKHAYVVQPKTSDKQPDITDAVLVSGVCKYWQDFGKVYRLANGSICEVSNRCSAVWDNEADYCNYDAPKSFSVYFGQW